MTVGAAKFGLLAAAGGGASPLVATGGIISQYDDSGTTYRVHAFRGSGKFVVASGEGEVEYLIVAGGGSGGASQENGYKTQGGGGGAGGLLTATGLSLIHI